MLENRYPTMPSLPRSARLRVCTEPCPPARLPTSLHSKYISH
jgi:hypothetical protein